MGANLGENDLQDTPPAVNLCACLRGTRDRSACGSISIHPRSESSQTMILQEDHLQKTLCCQGRFDRRAYVPWKVFRRSFVCAQQ